jgi:hypothetical protein
MIKYIVINDHEYIFDNGIPEVMIYNDVTEAFKEIFGEDLEDSEFDNLIDYWNDCIKNYVNGDGCSSRFIFELDLENNSSKMILG